MARNFVPGEEKARIPFAALDSVMGWSDYDGVERIEGRLGGKPVLKGTRVPADLVAECLDAGETPQDIAYNYTLKLQDVLNLKIYVNSQKATLKP